MFKDRDTKNWSHLHRTSDEHNNIRDDRLSRSITNETKNNTEKPRFGILDVIEPANAAVEDARVKNAGWQYSWKRTNRASGSRNVHEEKMAKKKTFEQYINTYNANLTKDSFVKTVVKTENGSKELFDEHINKVKEIEKKY